MNLALVAFFSMLAHAETNLPKRLPSAVKVVASSPCEKTAWDVVTYVDGQGRAGSDETKAKTLASSHDGSRFKFKVRMQTEQGKSTAGHTYVVDLNRDTQADSCSVQKVEVQSL